MTTHDIPHIVNRALFNQIADAIFVYSLADGVPSPFLEVNQTACEIVGYSREELLKMTPLDLMAEAVRDAAPDYARRIEQENNIVFEWTYLRKDGQVVDVEIHANAVATNNGWIVVSTCRDLSQCRRLQLQADTATMQYRALYENSHEAIFAIRADGTFLDLNPVAEKLAMRQKADVVGTSLFDFVLLDEPKEHCLEWIQAVMLGQSREKQLKWKSSNGQVHRLNIRAVPYIVDGQVVGVRGVLHDFTREYELERSLQHAELRLRNIFDSVRLFLWSYSLVTKCYTYCTENVVEIFGIAAERILCGEVQLTKFVHPDDAHRVGEAFRRVRRGQELNIEFRMQPPGQNELWVHTVARARKDADGKVVYVDGVTLDIHEAKMSTLASEVHRNRFEVLLNVIPDAIVLHQSGIIRYANRSVVDMLRLPEGSSPIGMSVWNVVDVDNHGEMLLRYNTLMKSGCIGTQLPPVEQKMLRSDGSTFYAETRSVLVEDQGIPSVLSVVKDITAAKEMSEHLSFMAYHDELTGTANRRALTRYLEALLVPADASVSHAVFLLDLDRFKYLNDLHGHRFGDEVLQMVAQRLRCFQNEDYILARVGGDEFVLVFARVNVSQVDRIATELLGKLSIPFSMNNGEYRLTPSIGIAIYPQDGTDVESLLKRADVAMYQSKARGGNQATHFESVFEEEMKERMHIEQQFERSLQSREFYLEYQPKVTINQREICAVEALVRWKTKDGQVLSPDRFIPIAEENGFIILLGKWVLEEACTQSVKWWEMYRRRMVVSVNVSPKQFKSTSMFEVVATVLKQTGLPARYLTIEITEGLMMDNSKEIAETLKRLRQLGVKIAVDDFGTGYSSLRYLRHFEPTHLKIDRSFIANMLEDQENMGIVTAIIQLGHTMGAAVVAEGVETEEQWRYLQSAGCDIAQGYLFSRPVSADEIVRKWFEH